MSYRLVFIYFLLLLSILSGCTQKHELPNIIIIMADDLGYGDLGCYGNAQMDTPNLDLLASQGIQFMDFHSNGPVCTPTRAAFLTGRYQQRSGLEGVIYAKGQTRETGLALSEETLAEVLKSEGYATGIMGKWHLGYQQAYNPIYQGFDQFYGYVSGNVDYHSHYDYTGIYDWYHNLDTVVQKGYVTDLITQNATAFIEQHRHQPFFLFVSHEAPHAPFQGRQDSAHRFPDRTYSYYGPEEKHSTYQEMIEVMDEGVGEIINSLKRLELTENTLVFFFSDNGPEKGVGSTGRLSGRKGSLWEGGHRVPGIVYWEGKLRHQISQEVVMSFDIFPTILSIIGNTDAERLSLDGRDISPLLFKQEALDEQPLFWRYRNQRAVRMGAWKLLINKSDTALFNLREDPKELNNLGLSQVQTKMSLLNELIHWEKELANTPQKTH